MGEAAERTGIHRFRLTLKAFRFLTEGESDKTIWFANSQLVRVRGADGTYFSGRMKKGKAEFYSRQGYANWLDPELLQLLVDAKSEEQAAVNRFVIKEREEGRCFWCGGKGDTVDHLFPESLGGATLPENTVWGCHSCNEKRGITVPSNIEEIWEKLTALDGRQRFFDLVEFRKWLHSHGFKDKLKTDVMSRLADDQHLLGQLLEIKMRPHGDAELQKTLHAMLA